MNRFEYNEILKEFNLKKSDMYLSVDEYKEPVYGIGDIIFYYKRSQVFIDGNIPFQVLKNLYLSSKEIILEEVKRELPKQWKIKNKEGFIRLLSFLSNEYRETNINYNEVIKKINKQILQSINPNDQPHESMIKNEKDFDIYFNTIAYSSLQFKKIRTLLYQFDQIINPFMNRSIELKDGDEYVDRVTITGSHDQSDSEMHIKDIQGNTADSHKGSNGFDFKLFYKIYPEQLFTLWHSYEINHAKESVAIYYCGNYINDEKHYDLTKGNIRSCSGKEMKMTSQDEEGLVLELRKALMYGSKITIYNMQKEGIQRKRKHESN